MAMFLRRLPSSALSRIARSTVVPASHQALPLTSRSMTTTTTSIRIHPSAIVNSKAYLSTGSSADKSPREKLHDIIENYRQLNYSQETFSRFIKEVVKAADENKDGMISVVEVEHLLSNIGAHEALTPSEIKSIMEELGCADQVKGAKTPEENAGIPASKVVDFFHLQPPKP